jgi:4-aminobutyrate aminotransferase-like enzyme
VTGASRNRPDAGEVIGRLGGGGTRRIAASAGLVATGGRGSYVRASNGQRYLDFISGFGVASVGHSHPRWVDAVVAQAGRLAVTPLHTDELARYLEALTAVLPAGTGQAALFSGGTEAVEVAVRLAQTATGRRGVIAFDQSFHGKSLAVRYSGDLGTPEASSLAPGWLKSAPFPPCERHDAVSYGECGESSADVLEHVDRREDLADVGAVLVEPVLGTAGNIPPRRPFLDELRALCDQRGWLMIVDEMITGFGRTGELFAVDTLGVSPDVFVLGKGMGGGFPLSAVCASPDLWGSSSLAEPSATATSYGGNPLACAAGTATLEILLADGFLEQVRTVAAHCALRLRELAAASPRVSSPRGLGLMLGFDLVDPQTGRLAHPESCRSALRHCRELGLLVVADVPRVRLSPPLTLTIDEADQAFGVLSEVLT